MVNNTRTILKIMCLAGLTAQAPNTSLQCRSHTWADVLYLNSCLGTIAQGAYRYHTLGHPVLRIICAWEDSHPTPGKTITPRLGILAPHNWEAPHPMPGPTPGKTCTPRLGILTPHRVSPQPPLLLPLVGRHRIAPHSSLL